MAARHPSEIENLEPHDAAISHHSSTLDEAFISPFPGERSNRPKSVASERTPLLGKPTRPSTSDLEDGEVQEHATASFGLATLSFFSAALLAFANFGFLVLTFMSTVHSSLAAVLPAHRSSTFLPIWLSAISFLTAFLHMLYFAAPNRSPILTVRALNVASSLCLLACLLLVTINKELRYKEAILTIIVAALSLATHIQAVFRPRITIESALPIFKSTADLKHDHAEPETTAQKTGHFFATLLSLLTITFPLFLVHLAIFAALLGITANLGLRAYDSKLQPYGRLFWVNPATAETEGLVDRYGVTGRSSYRLHLFCEGGSDYDGRTVLLEGPASRPGVTSGDWIFNVTERLDANSTIRVCRYDRPGYGFSDNAPTAALGHVSKALEEALDKAGEFARVSKPGGGFILVAEGYGGLASRVFAARNAKHVRGMLLIDPQTEATYFEKNRSTFSFKRDLTFVFRDVIGTSITPLGIRRWIALLTSKAGRSSEARVLSDAKHGLSPGFGRTALQQAHEAHPFSRSYETLLDSRKDFPSDRPSILISSKDRLKHKHSWQTGHDALVRDVLGKGFKRWEQVNSGHDVCESALGRQTCQRALSDLLRIHIK